MSVKLSKPQYSYYGTGTQAYDDNKCLKYIHGWMWIRLARKAALLDPDLAEEADILAGHSDDCQGLGFQILDPSQVLQCGHGLGTSVLSRKVLQL